jgi:iron complex transport system substrate-binding protein
VRIKLLAVVCALLLSVLAASCGGGGQGETIAEETTGEETSSYPVTIKDATGRKVTVESKPKEIGSMVPSVTETVFKVGAGDRLAGVTTAADYPEEAKQVEPIGDFQGVNAEKGASLGIDVLFLSFDTTAEKAKNLRQKTGAKTVVIDPQSVDEAIESIGLVGKIVGNKEKAESVEQKLRGQLEDIEQKVSGEPEPTVFYEVSNDPLFTASTKSFVGDAIRLAGAKNVVESDQEFPQYSLEKLLEKNPDYYLVGDGSTGTAAEDVKSRPRYGSLKAVEQDHVRTVEADLVSRPGPRIVEGVREIAEAVHPDAFE